MNTGPHNDHMVTLSLLTLLNNSVIIQSNTTIKHDERMESYWGLRVRDMDVVCSGLVHLRTSKKAAFTYASMLPYYPPASLLLPGGRTSHSRFIIPFNLMENSVYGIKQNTQLAELMQEVRLIIWDEALVTQRYAFKALDTTLRDVLGFNNPEKEIVFLGG
uniref:ATP-dependent DNA helicase n=1 Tax=Tanacetum cinerariifolium TaxID=118510 RepID=A0A699HEI9_TANCI|nr:ATP-dependent DNA helicase PIF7-like [Tanacetum cinerariifolium]